jgi:hypothetical protein
MITTMTASSSSPFPSRCVVYENFCCGSVPGSLVLCRRQGTLLGDNCLADSVTLVARIPEAKGVSWRLATVSSNREGRGKLDL